MLLNSSPPNSTYCPANVWLEPLPNNATILPGTLAELPVAHIASFAPDTVIHAAWHGVSNQHRNEPSQIAENLMPTVRLLEVARDAHCKNFIGLGSQAEYGPHAARLTPRSPRRMPGSRS